MIQIGIIGLPNSGKTTLHNAICSANRPTTIYPNMESSHHSAVVHLHDPRLDALQEIYQSKKKTQLSITFVDFNGIGSSASEGLPGALRNPLAAMDGFIYTLRSFESLVAPHPSKLVDPRRDFSQLEGEFLLSDQLTVEKRLDRISSETALKGPRRGEELAPERQLLEKLMSILDEGRPLRTEPFNERDQLLLNGFGLLSIKPVLALLNLGDETQQTEEFPEIHKAGAQTAHLHGALEWEISQLPKDEQSLFLEEYGIQELIAPNIPFMAMSLIHRITFFTAADKEARAWSLRRGGSALEAAAQVHSDLARGFIRAEVMATKELIATGSEAAMRADGKLRLEGKEYPVQEGDILLIRFNI